MATDAGRVRPTSASSSVTNLSDSHAPITEEMDGTFPPATEVVEAEEQDVVGAWGRPISRFGFHRVSRVICVAAFFKNCVS